MSRGDQRLLADVRRIERLVARREARPLDRLEHALGHELAGKLVFALARTRRPVPFCEAAA